MDVYDLTEFTWIRTVCTERNKQGSYSPADFEGRQIGLYQYESEYCLLYWHDPLPGGCGDIRCEGIVHISEAEAKKDDRELENLYYITKKKYLIDIGLHQAEMTLTYLSAAYCADRVCFVWCASKNAEDRSAGCIEFTMEEMQMMTDKKLRSVLRKAIPKGTVIPPFRLHSTAR